MWMLGIHRKFRSMVHSMKWSSCCNTVEVYELGITHWLIAPLVTKVEGGYVELSDD